MGHSAKFPAWRHRVNGQPSVDQTTILTRPRSSSAKTTTRALHARHAAIFFAEVNNQDVRAVPPHRATPKCEKLRRRVETRQLNGPSRRRAATFRQRRGLFELEARDREARLLNSRLVNDHSQASISVFRGVISHQTSTVSNHQASTELFSDWRKKECANFIPSRAGHDFVLQLPLFASLVLGVDGWRRMLGWREFHGDKIFLQGFILMNQNPPPLSMGFDFR